MKVVITKNNDENYWYNDRIGEVFEVEETTYPLYYRASGRYKGCYIDKDDCEIIKENPLEGADKLSEQIITSEWAKMPQVVKRECEMKEKEYVVLQDIMTIPADKIKLKVGTDFVGSFDMSISTMYIPTDKIDKFIQQGIIAEKKSRREEIAEQIDDYVYRNNINNRRDIKKVIITVLEKAGIE